MSNLHFHKMSLILWCSLIGVEKERRDNSARGRSLLQNHQLVQTMNLVLIMPQGWVIHVVAYTVAYQLLNVTLQEGKSSTKKDTKDDDVDEEEWSVDTSEDAVKARMEKMTNGVATLTMHSDLEKTSAERVDLFYKFSKVNIVKEAILYQLNASHIRVS